MRTKDQMTQQKLAKDFSESSADARSHERLKHAREVAAKVNALAKDMRSDASLAGEIYFADTQQRAVDRLVALQKPISLRRGALRFKSEA